MGRRSRLLAAGGLLALMAAALGLWPLRPMTPARAEARAVDFLSGRAGRPVADFEATGVASHPLARGWVVLVWDGQAGSRREVLVDESGSCRIAEGGTFDGYRELELRRGRLAPGGPPQPR